MRKLMIVVVASLMTATCSPSVKSDYVIPGTISTTCGPTLPQYTYCP